MNRPPMLDTNFTRAIIKWMSKSNVFAYRATGGRIGGKWRVGSAAKTGLPICLLTTTGRKSGEPRVSPLLFLEEDGRVVLVASQGGQPKHPQWYFNIKANPRVKIQIRSDVRELVARVADDDEHARLWPKLVAMYPEFDDYQSWVERKIPVIVCA
ncbi:nitroreductase family deazaflavin-dependent oxidoreductase [Rhodococcus kronopolitis]|uniref:Nitroreductase family deazaflavin-dependent oxidoreductase n=1 Tax=Rhodococcus kronopolitis TaxID=1460226 RepID=A0ABV9FRP7_9NOCA